MRVTVSGATGLIGSRLVAELQARGDEVTVLSRDPDRARNALGDVEAFAWDTKRPPPAEALAGRDGVAHLVGERIDQRWSDDARRRIRESRIVATHNLVAGLRAAAPRPGVLVCASGVGAYGPHGDEIVDESAPMGDGWLDGIVAEWEAAAGEASELGMRVVHMRTGVVLAPSGGALAKMLPPYRAGVGGPIAGGRHYMAWIHLDDVVAMYIAALDDERWSGPVNATAPQPVTNRAFSQALGRALHRPAIVPVPGLVLRLIFGHMSVVVTTGQRAVPRRATELGFQWRHPEVGAALRSALGVG